MLKLKCNHFQSATKLGMVCESMIFILKKETLLEEIFTKYIKTFF